MSTKIETQPRNYFQEYKTLSENDFEKFKTEYLAFMEDTRDYKKVNRHNEYRNEIYQKKEREILDKLGNRQRFLINVKEEYDNSKNRKYSEIFNARFNDIPDNEKPTLLKQLAEKKAWDTIFKFWGIMGDYYNKLETLSLIEALIEAQPELATFFATILEQKKSNFLTKLYTRVGLDGQISFAETEMLKLREDIEGDSINDIYNLFSKSLNDMLSTAKSIGASFKLSKTLFPKEFPFSKEFNSIIENALVTNLDFNENELSHFFTQLEQVGFKSGLLDTAAKSEDKPQAFVYVLLYFHYQKLYLNFLIEKMNELNQPEKGLTGVKEFEKFDWLGTQKQLGELFVELERKGWINEIKVKLVKEYFTNSNTIEQTLKPHHDKGEKLFKGIYTKAYSPSFKEIKPNKTN